MSKSNNNFVFDNYGNMVPKDTHNSVPNIVKQGNNQFEVDKTGNFIPSNDGKNSAQRHYEAQWEAWKKYGDAAFRRDGDTELNQPSENSNYWAYQSYLDSQREALKAAMERAKENAGEVKENTISRAYQEYLKATNAYGVEAENLGGIGLARNGGYSERMATNNFNAYQNYSVNANNAHAAALTEIDLAKSAGEADLALKGYQMAQQDKMNDMQYNQGMASYKQTLISTASVIAGTLAKWSGNKISNMNEIVKSIKKDYPALSESEISAIIASITK